METVEEELQALCEARRGVARDLIGVLVGAVCLLGLAPEISGAPRDLVSTFLLALALYSGMFVHSVSRTGATLEQECPRCGDTYFGGLAAVGRSLPLPADACVHCGLALAERHLSPREAPATPPERSSSRS